MTAVPSGAGPTRPHVDPVPVEARPIQGRRAGVVTRTAANVVDFGITVGLLLGGYMAWSAARFLVEPAQFSWPAPPFLAFLAAGACLMGLYFTCAWATTGRTYGDHLLGLRVVNSRGERVRWGLAAVRAAFCLVVPIGLFWSAVSRTNRSLQDTVLRTYVVYDWTTRIHRSGVVGTPT